MLGFSGDLGSQSRTHGMLFGLLGWIWPGVHDLPAEVQHQVEFVIRKAAHLTAYGVLGALLHRGSLLSGGSAAGSWRLAGPLALAYAAMDETHQSFLASRTGSAWDVLLDGVGAALGILAHRLWRRLRAA